MVAVDRERRHQKHRQMIMAKYEGICHICEEPYADAIDHVVPVAKGGSDHPDNLRPAHTACNSKKGAKSYPKWAEENSNMWLPSHEPAAKRAARAKRQRERSKREAENDRALQRAEVRARKANDKQRLSLERLKAQAQREGAKDGFEDIKIEELVVNTLVLIATPNWSPYGESLMRTPPATTGAGGLKLLDDLHQKILAKYVLASVPDLAYLPRGERIPVLVSGVCTRCRGSMAYDEPSRWRHECTPNRRLLGKPKPRGWINLYGFLERLRKAQNKASTAVWTHGPRD